MIVALQRHPKSFAPQLLQFLAISPGPLFLPLDWSVFGSRTKRYQTLSTKELRDLSAPGECSESKQDSSNKVNRQPRRTQFANWKRSATCDAGNIEQHKNAGHSLGDKIIQNFTCKVLHDRKLALETQKCTWHGIRWCWSASWKHVPGSPSLPG